jgi:DNA-binding PadR family transcriptional regulator
MGRRIFGHGALRLYLLTLLAERPMHGYELIRLMEDQFLGLYTPSAGTIYPRLSALEAEGLVTHDEVEGRKVYRLTEAGRAEVEARRGELADLRAQAAEAARTARRLARRLGDDVRSQVGGLRGEWWDFAREARERERRARRQAQQAWGPGGRFGPEAAWELARRFSGLGSVVGDLQDLAADVAGALRSLELDPEQAARLREALSVARDAVLAALHGTPGGGSGEGRRGNGGSPGSERDE